MGKPVRGAGYQQRRLGGRIKEAYRDKVKRYHPDACEKENAEELFKRVKHARNHPVRRERRHGFRSGNFEVTQRFEDGWLLGKRDDVGAEDGRWFVFREFETAPHVDEKEFIFLADDGAMEKEATYFETSDAAEHTVPSSETKRRARSMITKTTTASIRRRGSGLRGTRKPKAHTIDI